MPRPLIFGPFGATLVDGIMTLGGPAAKGATSVIWARDEVTTQRPGC
jgi:hypothetical protein